MHSLISALGALPHAYVVAILLALAIIIASRLPIVGWVVRLAISVALFAVLIVVIGEHAYLDPYLDRIASALHLDDQEVVGQEVHIPLARDGHFWAQARIDGVERSMLIDSGATLTALSPRTAAAAGLDVRRGLIPILLRTANGTVPAGSAKVKELRLGDITARNLAVVVAPGFGDTDVIGMNFLSRLKSWRVDGRTLVLVPHHPQPEGAAGPAKFPSLFSAKS